MLNCKNVISYKNYIFQPKEYKPVKVASDFVYDIDSFKYPFYLLKTNKNLFDLFKSNLHNELNAILTIK